MLLFSLLKLFFIALGENCITFERIRALRKTTETQKRADVITFFQDIVPCLSGRREWEMKRKNTMISNIITPSIEAMALWIIDNYGEKWLRGGKKTEKAKYTCFKQGNKLFGGWNEIGIERFNELVRHVRKNREEDENFEEMFLKFCQAEDDEKDVKQEETTSETRIFCLDDLDDDDSSAEQGSENLSKRSRSSVPPFIDVCETSEGQNDVNSQDISLASRSSSSTRASMSNNYQQLYGSFTIDGDTVQNRAEI